MQVLFFSDSAKSNLPEKERFSFVRAGVVILIVKKKGKGTKPNMAMPNQVGPMPMNNQMGSATVNNPTQPINNNQPTPVNPTTNQ